MTTQSHPYRNGATVFYDPSGNQGSGGPGTYNRATVESSEQQDDGSYLYTICVLLPRDGGGVTPQKPDLTGVTQNQLITIGG